VWAITREEKREWYSNMVDLSEDISNLLDYGAGKGQVEGKTEE
jgi:hypothetical protein